MAGKISLKEYKRALGMVEGGGSRKKNLDEVDRFAYKIVGVLAECSSNDIRKRAVKKALSLLK